MQALLGLGLLLAAQTTDTTRQEYVRTTFYTLQGTTASGTRTHLGTAACSKWMPFGTQLEFWDGFIVTCEDRGDGDKYWEGWVDIWSPSHEWGVQNVQNCYGDYTWVTVLRWGPELQ